jgi:hypothetical protein
MRTIIYNNLYKYDADLFEEEICGTGKYAK